MRAADGKNFPNIGAGSTAAFQLAGGVYTLAAQATWGGGSATVHMLMPDGATYVATALTLTADGMAAPIALPPGSYKVVVVTSSAVYASVIRIPGD